MAQLAPSPTLESIYKGPGTSNIEIPVFVGGASSNHMGEALRLIKHLNKDIRPEYPTLKLFFYDLGLTASEFQEVGKYTTQNLIRIKLLFLCAEYPINLIPKILL